MSNLASGRQHCGMVSTSDGVVEVRAGFRNLKDVHAGLSVYAHGMMYLVLAYSESTDFHARASHVAL